MLTKYKGQQMKRFSVIMLIFFCACTSKADDLYCSWPSSLTLNSIVPLESGANSHASGVVVSKDLVLTAAHVLEDYFDTYIEVGNELRIASVLLVDKEADMALLSVKTDGLYPISLSNDELNQKQEVWAVGYPLAQAQHISTGNFNFRHAEALHTSAGIDSGASGGGLLSCEKGQFVLAGMLRGYGAHRTSEGLVRLNNYSVSVAASDIKIVMQLNQSIHIGQVEHF